MLAVGLVYASVASVYDQSDTAALEALNRSGIDEVVMMRRRITSIEFKEVPVGTARVRHEEGRRMRWSTRHGPRVPSVGSLGVLIREVGDAGDSRGALGDGVGSVAIVEA